MTSSSQATPDRVVDALVAARLLDPSRRTESLGVVARAMAVPQAPASTGSRGMSRLVEVVAYLGGALVLAAGSLFLAEEWGTLGFGTHVVLLALVTLVLLGAGVVAAQALSTADDRRAAAYDARRRLSGVLLSGGALGAAGLAGLLVDNWAGQGYDGKVHVDGPWAAAGIVALLVALVGRRFAPTALSVVVMAAGLFAAVLALVQGIDVESGVADGLALVLAAAAWLVLTERGLFGERTLARSLGAVIAFVGAQLTVIDGDQALGYALTAVLAAAGIALYVQRLAWPYLAVAVIAVTVVVPEAVTDWTHGSLGATGGVLLAGVTLLLASFAGYRLRSETVI